MPRVNQPQRQTLRVRKRMAHGFGGGERALGSRDYGTGNVYEMRIYTFAPGDMPKKVFFSNSGAEAVESALKLAMTA